MHFKKPAQNPKQDRIYSGDFDPVDVAVIYYLSFEYVNLHFLKMLFTLFFRQTALQHQAVEDFHRLFQLPSRGSHCRREDFLLPWRFEPRPSVHGTDQTHHETHRRTRPGTLM